MRWKTWREKLREVLALAGIAELVYGVGESPLRLFELGECSKLHLRTTTPTHTQPSVYEELRRIDDFFRAGF